MRKQSSAELAVSANATMAYLPASVPRQLVEMDRGGRGARVFGRPELFTSPRYSPDGRRVAVVVGVPPSTNIFIYELPAFTPRRLTFRQGAGAPEWSHDGRRVGWTEVTGSVGYRGDEFEG